MTRNKIFDYVGAKSYLFKALYSNFPKNHLNLKWCDVFGGSGIMTYMKPKCEVELFNDLSEGISAIFWCLINQFPELYMRLQYAIRSEKLFHWFKEFEPVTRLDQAVRALYLFDTLYNGKQGNIYARFYKHETEKGRDRRIFDYELFEMWRKRFERVLIFSEDFQKFIERTDESTAFFYCDPEYYGVLGKGYYEKHLSDSDHVRLRNVLSNIKGKFLLSYDNHPRVAELYEGFNIKTVSVVYTAHTKNKRYNEFLISNYPMQEQNKLDQFFL